MGVSNCFSGMDHAIQGVGVRHADLAGIMIRRNDLATNLLSASSTQLLPPMLKVVGLPLLPPHCKLHSHTTQVGNPKLQTLNRKPWTW